MVSTDSVRPTVATACTPTRPTKKISTTAKSDSITISSTMGTDSKKMARRMLPVVKLVSEPCRAIRRSRKNLSKLCCAMKKANKGVT